MPATNVLMCSDHSYVCQEGSRRKRCSMQLVQTSEKGLQVERIDPELKRATGLVVSSPFRFFRMFCSSVSWCGKGGGG